MTVPTARVSDAADYVSMHHRIRKDMRRRLKHLAADLDKPVTDIVNEAIMAHVEKVTSPGDRLEGMPPEPLLRELRRARADGTFYETASRVGKTQLIEVSRLLGERSDMRSSGDRLISRIAAALAEPEGA